MSNPKTLGTQERGQTKHKNTTQYRKLKRWATRTLPKSRGDYQENRICKIVFVSWCGRVQYFYHNNNI